MQDVHQAARDGYAHAANEYERGRPAYPPQLMDWLRNQLQLQAGMSVLELGAGTGKFTPHLLQTGAAVIAVEPVSSMLAKLTQAYPQVDTRLGSAEAIPAASGSVEVVLCAQSFHWFATPAALAEIYRVLKPGGRLGLVWNLRDERVAWVKKLDQLINQVEGNTPRYYTGHWRAVFPHPGFGLLHEQSFTNSYTGPAEDVIMNRVRSISFVAALPPEQRARLEEQVQALLASEPALQNQPSVTMPYQTAAVYTVKTTP